MKTPASEPPRDSWLWEWLGVTNSGPPLRRTRVTRGRHRDWTIIPRYGTGPEDRWTILASPRPAGDNPAAAIEDGQFPDLSAAYAAVKVARRIDNGESERA